MGRADPSAELFISTITIHELEHGVLLMVECSRWTSESRVGQLPCTYRIQRFDELDVINPWS